MHDWEKQQTQQVFPLSWVFLADPVPEHRKVACSCVMRSVPSQYQQLGTPPLVHSSFYTPSILMSLTSYATTHITMWHPDDVILCLAGSPCTCIPMLEQKSLVQSMSVSTSTLNLLLWSQKLSNQVHTMTYRRLRSSVASSFATLWVVLCILCSKCLLVKVLILHWFPSPSSVRLMYSNRFNVQKLLIHLHTVSWNFPVGSWVMAPFMLYLGLSHVGLHVTRY